MPARAQLCLLIFVGATIASLVHGQDLFTEPESARRRAVAPAPLQRSSAALIDIAAAEGKLDSETALKYQVYAAFGDCRLPKEFRGDDSSVFDTLILDDVAARFGTLSPATQSILLPYLREPYEDDGWLNAQATACGSGKASAVPSTSVIAVLDGKVTIRYRPQDQQVAQSIAAAVPPIWTKLTSVMGREPKLYPNSGPLRLNINVVEITGSEERGGRLGTTNFKIPSGGTIPCKFAASFIQIDPRRGGIDATVAHELMHAFQNAFDVKPNCVAPEYKWWKEATATWAMDSTTNPPEPPAGNSEHPYASEFMKVPELPLDCLDTRKCDLHEYGAYVLPFYIAGRYTDPQFVRRSWEAAAGNLSLDAVNVALAPYGGFEKEWPEFVRYNFNREPITEYEKWDSLGPGGARAKEEYENVDLAEDDNVYKMESTIDDSKKPLVLKPLSAQYFHYYLAYSENVRSVAFLNGLTFKLDLRPYAPVPEWGSLYVLDDVPAEKKQGAHVQALLKINGQWETNSRDWTDTPYAPFCREVDSEKIDEIVIIYSNSSRETVQAAGRTPVLFVSNMGCSGWKTESASFDDTADDPLHYEWSATFRRKATPTPSRWHATAIPDGGFPVLGFDYEGTGTTTFRAQGSRRGCTFSGNGSAPLDAVRLTTWNFVPPDGTHHRLYWGLMGTSQNLGTYTATCNGTVFTAAAPPTPWVILPEDDNRASFDGAKLEGGKSMLFEGLGTYQWKIVLDPNP